MVFSGLVSKVSYTLHYDGTMLKPSDIALLNPSLLALSGASLSQSYTVLGASEAAAVMQYSKLFSLTFSRAPLNVDRVPFENQLQSAWRNYKGKHYCKNASNFEIKTFVVTYLLKFEFLYQRVMLQIYLDIMATW